MSAQTSTRKGKISTYFKGVKAEMRKVLWPSKKELTNYTAMVILISIIVGLVVWVLDLGIHRILSLIIK
ncbi:preprotein translocase subunit SecE [Clostridium sp. Cult2]|uniref:preprotein translocase subunit SecE n=1 Tax=Clostridium sp. Cult2 TaxID=2079003 RepID=UPI001F014CA9|nr:preprotein translocase subunit SecE [Clostridium sp. Cult2]MCF6464400.1 preprotein translocase subunit SecE [Clostridium sp. Cult2]